jgi:Uma2 family endonuclease
MFYKAERINAYREATPDYKLKPYILVPDLVVEVVSPNDDLRELDKKVDLYLADGVLMVWVMDPQPIKVSVFTPTPGKPRTRQQTNLFGDDILTGGEIIPGFEIVVAKLFE